MSIFDNLKKTVAAATGGLVGTTNKTFTFAALPESLAQMQALPEAALTDPFRRRR